MGITCIFSLEIRGRYNHDTKLGKHINMKTKKVVKGSKCKYDKVTAFRLEPAVDNSFYSIDGEKYEAKAI